MSEKEKKSKAEQLKEKLFYKKEHSTLTMSDKQQKAADRYC